MGWRRHCAIIEKARPPDESRGLRVSAHLRAITFQADPGREQRDTNPSKIEAVGIARGISMIAR